jgi:hypothetical protein
VAKQQSTKKMVLVVIARGGATCDEGGLHENNKDKNLLLWKGGISGPILCPK